MNSALLLPLVGALWLVAAAAATIAGIRRAAAGARATADTRAVVGLLAAAPVVPLLVHADGRVDAEARVADWLGLDAPPRRLADLADGAGPAEIDRLERAVAESFASGAPLALVLGLPGSERRLCVQGAPYAAPGVAERAILLWLSDVTDTRREIDRLGAEAARLGRALDGLSTLIEAAPWPMWYRGPDLDLALVNGAYVRAVEAADAAEVVRRGMELIESAGEGGPSAIAAAARDRQLVSIRTAPAIVAGQRRMMRVVDVPIGTIGVAGFATDVQELEDARADLVRFSHAQRDMLDRLSAGVAQFAGDRSLVFSNRHFLRLFALEPEWLAENPEFDRVLERMREAQRVPESRDFPGWKAERRAWFNSTQPIEENWLLPGGTHLRVVAQPLPDGGLLLIFEDRTEHLQLASARDTLVRVRTATFDNLFEAIGVFASDGRLHLWNNRFREVWELEEADILRHPRVDALVQSIAPRLADPSRAGMIRELVRVATIDRQQRSGRIALRDGRHFQFAAVPLPDGNALFTLLDITASHGIEEALRDRNEALEEANRLKTAFVENMSYELRVPLTSIAGFAEMLAGGYAGELNATAQDYVDSILVAVQRLGTLIGDVLDLSQSEVGSLPMHTERVSIGPLVHEAAQAASEDARRAGLSLTVDLPTQSPMVEGDRRRLRQCLDHLLRNAVSYTPPGGQVQVICRSDGENAEVAVVDNGQGIEPDRRARLFEGLDRARLGATREADGSRRPGGGIGLPLARQLVEAHGGTLALESEVGQGTRVIVRLPLVPPDVV